MTKTKEKILNTTITAWSANINTSLDDIATQAGVSRRTLHRHFDGKEDLVAHVMQYLLDNYVQSLDSVIDVSDTSIIQLKKLFYNDVRQAENYLLFSKLNDTAFSNDKVHEKVNEKQIAKIYQTYRNIFATLIANKEVSELMTQPWLEAFYASVVEASIKRIQNDAVIEDAIFIAWQTFCRGIGHTG